MSLRHLTLAILGSLIAVLSILALQKYPGQGGIYVLFAVVSNSLLFFGFRRNAIFFDTFIGVFLWLGFWLKLSIRVAFMDGRFSEAVGNFDGTGVAFDRALLVTTCGLSGLMAASYLREKVFFVYPDKLENISRQVLLDYYIKYRSAILTAFVMLFASIGISNAYFGIYQRGVVPATVLPFGLGGIYSWLLLFGFATVSALILHFEFTSRERTTFSVTVLCLLEAFASNVSLLSRGMILNSSAIGYGVIRSIKKFRIRTTYWYWLGSFLMFFVLFLISVVWVNHLRLHDSPSFNAVEVASKTKALFLDRWVGMEGVMAVSSYPKLDWELWTDAWKERYSRNKMSFYDTNIITSPYKNVDMTKHHYVSLPGILAFCFYPGSFLFLFTGIFLLGLLAAAIEFSVFKLGGGNLILCALLAQVVAYRYAHFGYVPGQSYLLFGALFLNLFIIYFSNKFLLYWNKRTAVSVP